MFSFLLVVLNFLNVIVLDIFYTLLHIMFYHQQYNILH